MQLENLILPFRSIFKFLALTAEGRTELRSERVGEVYTTDRGGKYSIFRETRSRDGTVDTPAVLVCGFRFRWFNSNRVLHWTFRRVCIISSPIWAGFPGYRVKLWMIDFQTKDYLGIYEWAGEKNGRAYADWLVLLLRRISTRGSVWYQLYPRMSLSTYLNAHKVSDEHYNHSFTLLTLI